MNASITLSILLLLMGAMLVSCSFATIEARETGFVVRVTDGDTFVLENGERVRLICVNTPEKNEAGYGEAKQFLAQLVLNKTVLLEKDQRDRDAFHRMLRYVYVLDSRNGSNERRFINRELVQQGFAKVKRYPPDIRRCDEIAR